MSFEEWWNSPAIKAGFREYESFAAKAAWNAALEEAARECQSHEPKDFTVAGICTRAKCAEAILALREKP